MLFETAGELSEQDIPRPLFPVIELFVIVGEEEEHVRVLEAWITREEWELKNPLR